MGHENEAVFKSQRVTKQRRRRPGAAEKFKPGDSLARPSWEEPIGKLVSWGAGGKKKKQPPIGAVIATEWIKIYFNASEE